MVYKLNLEKGNVPSSNTGSQRWSSSGCFVVDKMASLSVLTYRVFIIIIIIFFDPGTQFPSKEKITLCNIKKYKNQAGMNLTPPGPSQNSHAVRWHCTVESKPRVAEIKSWFLCHRPTDQLRKLIIIIIIIIIIFSPPSQKPQAEKK